MDPGGPTSSFSRRHRIATEHSALPGQANGAVPGEPLYSSSRELAIRIAEVIADTPAQNTVVIDIHHTSTVADCFVICSGENERQLRAIHRDVMEQLEEEGTFPRRIEGTPASGWILIDYGDVVVHIFDVDQRTFYRLEEVWKDAPTLLAIQ